jgi:hypothetical protein
LQDNHRALVVGTRTVGKGSVQTLIKLEEGTGAIKLTTAQYRLPSGRNIDRRGGEMSWGINPDDGYFVAMDQAQIQTLLQRQLEREIIGNPTGDRAVQNPVITARWIEEQQADPQLAAALKTLTDRLTGGQFSKISNISPAQIELFLKRDDVQRRRDLLLTNLEQLDREMKDLDRDSPAKN